MTSGYQKFCYWFDPDKLEGVEKHFKGMTLTEETHIPCRLLRNSSEIGLVSPSAWDAFCKRRTSWYSTSEKAGKTLVVSKAPLDTSEDLILIAETDFKPGRLPTREEFKALARSPSFEKRKPKAWERIDPPERDIYQRWFEKYEASESFDFKNLFVFHSANHANFLDPRIFVSVGKEKVPYSITDSLHTCSSCLEFFNILGENWSLKYVVPCIGAVQFARLPRDRYLKVLTMRKNPCQ